MTETLLTPDEAERFAALYGSAPKPVEPKGPGAFAGAYKGLAGIPSALAAVPLSIASAVTSVSDLGGTVLGRDYLADLNLSDDQIAELDKTSKDYFSTTWQYAIHQPIEQLRESAADYYRPDPQTTGFVGSHLFGVTDLLTRVGLGNLIAPGSGLALAAGTTGYERTQDLEAQGVDAQTAQASGALTGASLLASGGISSLGRTVIARAVSGSLLNAGFGAGTRALDSSILAAGGYTAQAEQQCWNDGAALAADLIIGGAFHLLPSRGKEAPAKPPAETVDAALTAKAAQGVTDSAPGVPADPMSASAHVTALDTAQAQLMDGQPVEVDPIVRDATFAPRPEESPGVDPMREALAEAGVPVEQLRSADAAAAEAAFRQRLESDPDRLFSDYAALPDSEGGRVLNTDTARELSPEYLADRTRSADIHEPASDTIKRLYAKKLAEPTPEGFDRSVMFTAGGTGAGKSTAIKALEGMVKPPEMIYDTNMNTLESAVKKVDQALAAGRDVQILYVYRDPVEALTGGALPRAERQAREFGTGRTVPLAEHARTHAGVRSVMEALAEKYRHDPRVDIRAYDNSRGKDNGGFADLADIPKVDQNGLHERLQAALQQEHQAGRISDATRAGFEAAGRNPQAVQRPSLRGGRGQPSEEHPAGRSPQGLSGPRDVVQAPPPGTDAARAGAEPAHQGTPRTDAEGQPRTGLDPARVGEVDRARAAAAAHPDAVLADGTTAAEALRSADHEVQEAQTQGEAIAAAVACFLRLGSEAA